LVYHLNICFDIGPRLFFANGFLKKEDKKRVINDIKNTLQELNSLSMFSKSMKIKILLFKISPLFCFWFVNVFRKNK